MDLTWENLYRFEIFIIIFGILPKVIQNISFLRRVLAKSKISKKLHVSLFKIVIIARCTSEGNIDFNFMRCVHRMAEI